MKNDEKIKYDENQSSQSFGNKNDCKVEIKTKVAEIDQE